MHASWGLSSRSEWRYFIAAMMLVLAQLATSWHISHEEPDAFFNGSDCAVCGIIAHAPYDTSPAPVVLPLPVLAPEVFLFPAPQSRVAVRIAARTGPRAPPVA